jgi:hypothetical protein
MDDDGVDEARILAELHAGTPSHPVDTLVKLHEYIALLE